MTRNFVCVGPNRGDADMAAMMRGHDMFYMFEPYPEAAAWLRDNNAHATDYLKIIEAACGEYDGTALLNVYNHNGVSSSLGVCTEQSKALYDKIDLSLKGQVEVKVVNLCNWLISNGIFEVKTLLIDAQGMDLAILKTLRPFLVKGAIKRIVHEVDGDGCRMYDGLPSNSFSDAMAFFKEIGGYEMSMHGERNSWNYDIEWNFVGNGLKG